MGPGGGGGAYTQYYSGFIVLRGGFEKRAAVLPNILVSVCREDEVSRPPTCSRTKVETAHSKTQEQVLSPHNLALAPTLPCKGAEPLHVVQRP